jgi:hypothetical protein
MKQNRPGGVTFWSAVAVPCPRVGSHPSIAAVVPCRNKRQPCTIMRANEARHQRQGASLTVEELVTDGSKARQGSAKRPYRGGRLEEPLLQPRHT